MSKYLIIYFLQKNKAIIFYIFLILLSKINRKYVEIVNKVKNSILKTE